MTKISPKSGQKFKCSKCGMEIQVTKDCNCKEPMAEFKCCGEALEAAK